MSLKVHEEGIRRRNRGTVKQKNTPHEAFRQGAKAFPRYSKVLGHRLLLTINQIVLNRLHYCFLHTVPSVLGPSCP
jgi:hypothetical protein